MHSMHSLDLKIEYGIISTMIEVYKVPDMKFLEKMTRVSQAKNDKEGILGKSNCRSKGIGVFCIQETMSRRVWKQKVARALLRLLHKVSEGNIGRI